MIQLAIAIICFEAVRWFISIVNQLFHQSLPVSHAITGGLVSVLIPARNEEKNIGNLLNDLLKLDFKQLEIFVFNDLSTDRTMEIVRQFTHSDSRVKLIDSEGLPEGWLGKNFACHTLANHASGEFLLFVDADVRLDRAAVSSAVNYLKKHQLGMLSIFPKQIICTIGEQLTVPLMNYILLTLLPLILVRKSKFSSLAAANGQFMLFNSNLYRTYALHSKFRLNKVEDIAIARFLKRSLVKIACLVGNDSVRCRMYTGFSGAVNGFSKNTINFFGNSYVLAVLFWILTMFGIIPVFIAFSWPGGLLYLAIIFSTRFIVSVISFPLVTISLPKTKQAIVENIMMHYPQLLVLGLFIYKSLINRCKRKYIWKDRVIE
jgi:glycosyltransferase involved in cell wall biosynthesis